MNTDVADARRSTRKRVTLGAAFYPEYLPRGADGPDDVRRHLDLMVEAGIGVIRVGESVWSTWEPRDGEFSLEWLAPVLDEAHGRGLRVILGTPTYAIPPWLQKKHPELAVVKQDGQRVGFGARQEVDYLAPTFRVYAERIIRAVLGRYAEHPAVEGVQLDNEPGLHLIANPHVVERFIASLRERYGTLEELNAAWGLSYWSHRLSAWEELWHPRGNTVPGYDLAWRRFQAAQTTEFIAWQAEIARGYLRPEQYVTTCIAYNRAAVDDVALGGALDVVAGNCYLDTQDALRHDAESHHGAEFWFTTSPVGLFQQADRMRSSKNGPFLVTETGANSIAGSHHNLPPYDGQLAQVAWALVARGARLVEYWHWHTLHHGAEQMWGGILGHSLEPTRVYREIAALGRDLARMEDRLGELQPDEDLGFLFSRDSRWAMQFQPPLADGVSFRGDRWSYDRIQARFAEAAFDAKLQAGVVASEQMTTAQELCARFPAVVVAGASSIDDATARTLVEYAALGGHLVLGIRSGAGDEHGGMRAEMLPGPFREAAGIRITEYSNLQGPVALLSGGAAEAWIDAIEAEGAVVVDGYVDPHFARWAAVTEHAWGSGRVTTIGTLPDRASLARILGARLARRSRDAFPDLAPAASVHGAVTARRERLWFLHNWSSEETRVRTAVPLRDATTGEPVETVTLPPWGVRVLAGEA